MLPFAPTYRLDYCRLISARSSCRKCSPPHAASIRSTVLLTEKVTGTGIGTENPVSYYESEVPKGTESSLSIFCSASKVCCAACSLNTLYFGLSDLGLKHPSSVLMVSLQLDFSRTFSRFFHDFQEKTRKINRLIYCEAEEQRTQP